MKKLTPLIFLLALSLGLRAQTDVSFYFPGHQDDWQLFMSSKVVSDMSGGNKVVIVTLTAGDASCGTCAYGSTVPYFLGRETGSVRSAKFAADLDGGVPGAVPDSSRVTINGHSIIKYVYQNTVNYFLRLPDGNGNGSGFSTTGFQSLQKLKQGTIPSISSIEGVVTYTSWLDLTNTLKAIINAEKGVDDQVWINAASLDVVANPQDHSDHTYSSVAAQDAVNDMLWVGINEFVDYYSSALPANLSISDHENAVAFFAISDWGLFANSYFAPFDDAHKAWLPMDYFAVKRVPEGTASLVNTRAAAETDPLVTKIPMVVSVTSPAYVVKDISMIISPFEKGELTTSVYDMSGKLVYKMDTEVKEQKAFLITLKNAVKESGNYIVKNILNGKYIESKKIAVE